MVKPLVTVPTCDIVQANAASRLHGSLGDDPCQRLTAAQRHPRRAHAACCPHQRLVARAARCACCPCTHGSRRAADIGQDRSRGVAMQDPTSAGRARRIATSRPRPSLLPHAAVALACAAWCELLARAAAGWAGGHLLEHAQRRAHRLHHLARSFACGTGAGCRACLHTAAAAGAAVLQPANLNLFAASRQRGECSRAVAVRGRCGQSGAGSQSLRSNGRSAAQRREPLGQSAPSQCTNLQPKMASVNSNRRS